VVLWDFPCRLLEERAAQQFPSLIKNASFATALDGAAARDKSREESKGGRGKVHAMRERRVRGASVDGIVQFCEFLFLFLFLCF
jgi:hypothetical protein